MLVQGMTMLATCSLLVSGSPRSKVKVYGNAGPKTVIHTRTTGTGTY